MLLVYCGSQQATAPCSKCCYKAICGGNATENRTLLRLFPLIFGSYVASDDLYFALILCLKEIVEFAFASSMHQSVTLKAKFMITMLFFVNCFLILNVSQKTFCWSLSSADCIICTISSIQHSTV